MTQKNNGILGMQIHVYTTQVTTSRTIDYIMFKRGVERMSSYMQWHESVFHSSEGK